MVLPDKAALLKFPSTPEEVETRHGADRELASPNIALKMCQYHCIYHDDHHG